MKFKLQAIDEKSDIIIYEGHCYSREGLEEELLRKMDNAIREYVNKINDELQALEKESLPKM